MSTTRSRLLVTALVAMALLATACSDDDGGGDGGDASGDAEAFCERLRELEDADDLDLDDVEGLAVFEELVELAPEEIDSDMARIGDAFEELQALDQDDPDSFGAAFEIILDPALASSLEDFAAYAEDECGVEVEGADEFGDVGDLDDLTADLSTDFSAEFPGDEDDEPSTSEALRDYLDANHPELSDLASGIGSVSLGESDVQVTLTLDETVDADTALAVCEATVDFAEQDGLGAIDVEVEDQTDTVLATGDLEGGCEAA